MSKNIVDGIDKVYYGILDENDALVGEMKLLSDKVVSISMTPSQESTPLYASNVEQLRAVGALTGEGTLTLLTLDTKVRADLFGEELAEKGGVIDSGRDKPSVVLQVEKTLDGNEMEYLQLFKVKFGTYTEGASTKTDAQLEVTNSECSFTCTQRVKDKKFKYAVRTTDEAFDKTAWDTQWGKQIIEPTVKGSTQP